MTKQQACACEARVQGRAGRDRVRVISSDNGEQYGVKVMWAGSTVYNEYWSGDAFRADFPARGIRPVEAKAPEHPPYTTSTPAKAVAPKPKAKTKAHKE